MLIMKTFYTEKGYQLDQMMYFYACLTLIMHIQTFLFTPITVVPKNQDLEGYSVFENVGFQIIIIFQYKLNGRVQSERSTKVEGPEIQNWTFLRTQTRVHFKHRSLAHRTVHFGPDSN